LPDIFIVNPRHVLFIKSDELDVMLWIKLVSLKFFDIYSYQINNQNKYLKSECLKQYLLPPCNYHNA